MLQLIYYISYNLLTLDIWVLEKFKSKPQTANPKPQTPNSKPQTVESGGRKPQNAEPNMRSALRAPSPGRMAERPTVCRGGC
jgi:hypothetical protein